MAQTATQPVPGPRESLSASLFPIAVAGVFLAANVLQVVRLTTLVRLPFELMHLRMLQAGLVLAGSEVLFALFVLLLGATGPGRSGHATGRFLLAELWLSLALQIWFFTVPKGSILVWGLLGYGNQIPFFQLPTAALLYGVWKRGASRAGDRPPLAGRPDAWSPVLKPIGVLTWAAGWAVCLTSGFMGVGALLFFLMQDAYRAEFGVGDYPRSLLLGVAVVGILVALFGDAMRATGEEAWQDR